MITIKIFPNPAMRTMIVEFNYEGMNLMCQIEEEAVGSYKTVLLESSTRKLMNLCMQALRDEKNLKMAQHMEESERVKFIGVD